MVSRLRVQFRFKQENWATISALYKANGKISSIDAREFCVRGLELQIGVLLLKIPADRQKKVVQSVLGCASSRNENLMGHEKLRVQFTTRQAEGLENSALMRGSAPLFH